MARDSKLLEQMPDRIKERMKELGLTQEALAKQIDVTRGAIAHYLTGRRFPPPHQVRKLAEALKTDPAWLQWGPNEDGTVRPYKELDPVPTTSSIPIIQWTDIELIKDPNKIDHKNIRKFVPHLFTDEPHSFALKVKGDAMTTPLGRSYSFCEGEIATFDPYVVPKHGDYVIAVLPNAKEATFKQYVIDGGVKYLKPLNPQYPIVQIEDESCIYAVISNRIWIANSW